VIANKNAGPWLTGGFQSSGENMSRRHLGT